MALEKVSRLRTFAVPYSLVQNVAGGPMHLACALGVRTIGIVVKKFNSERWMPPPSLARVVYQTQGHSITEL
ncbi:MAG: hypothetical protein ACTHLX_21510, partial [Candidatus Binatia bacterium]